MDEGSSHSTVNQGYEQEDKSFQEDIKEESLHKITNLVVVELMKDTWMKRRIKNFINSSRRKP